MKLNFTLKIIPFIYHETTADENAMIIDHIQTDDKADETYQELMEAKEMLDPVSVRPSGKCIKRILKYSREYIELP